MHGSFILARPLPSLAKLSQLGSLLEQQPGVTDVVVDADRGMVHLAFVPEMITSMVLARLIRHHGYRLAGESKQPGDVPIAEPPLEAMGLNRSDDPGDEAMVASLRDAEMGFKPIVHPDSAA